MGEIITLLSDWRLRDPYVAMLKGRILSRFPNATIVDVTHYIDKFDTLQASFLMRSCYKSFPQGSIHLMLTNTSFSSDFSPVLLKHDGHFFIGADDGSFFMMFGNTSQLNGMSLKNSSGRSVQDMLDIIGHIADNSLEDNLLEYNSFKRAFVEDPEYSEQNRRIEGQIIYIDAFNNAITDISAERFKQMVKNGPFTATIQSTGEWKIDKFTPKYAELGNEMFLTENELGHIEIAAHQSDVAILADLNPYDKVIINY